MFKDDQMIFWPMYSQYCLITVWIVPKLAIVVNIGITPFSIVNAMTEMTSLNGNTMRIAKNKRKTKITITFVSKDFFAETSCFEIKFSWSIFLIKISAEVIVFSTAMLQFWEEISTDEEEPDDILINLLFLISSAKLFCTTSASLEIARLLTSSGLEMTFEDLEFRGLSLFTDEFAFNESSFSSFEIATVEKYKKRNKKTIQILISNSLIFNKTFWKNLTIKINNLFRTYFTCVFKNSSFVANEQDVESTADTDRN